MYKLFFFNYYYLEFYKLLNLDNLEQKKSISSRSPDFAMNSYPQCLVLSSCILHCLTGFENINLIKKLVQKQPTNIGNETIIQTKGTIDQFFLGGTHGTKLETHISTYFCLYQIKLLNMDAKYIHNV